MSPKEVGQVARWIRLARPGASCACVFDRRPLPSSASSAPHARVVASTKSQRQATMDNDGIMTQLKKGDEVQDGDVIQLLLEQISSEADPTKLVKMVLCWEGVASSAHYCSYKALLKLRSIGWTIVKNSQNSAEKAKRELLVQLMSAEYPEASAQSIAKYAINFAKYLQMSDEEFASVDRIRFTNVGKKQADPVKCIGFSKLDASIILGKLSSSSETDALSDSDDGSDSESDALSDSDDGSDSESLPSIEIEAHSETSSLRRSTRSTKTTPQIQFDIGDEDSTGSGKNQSKAVSTSSEEDRLKQKPAPPKPKPNPAPPSSGKGKVRGRGKGATETVNEKKKPKEDSSLQRTTLIEPSLFNWLAPFLAPNQLADDLALLQRNLNVNRDENFFNHYLQLLQQLRHGQGVMYSAASKFRTYYEQQVEALQNYKVFEVKKNDSRRREFILSMDTTLAAKYSDAFTRNEIVVLCCLLASPALTFTNIDQKTTVAKKSGMIRGMSFLSPIVEAFFHDRLRQLGVINDKDHPKYMQPLSTVVLCSTYCYHQFVTWGHGDEFSSKIDLVFTLEGFPQFLSVNGKYVRVEHESEVMYAKVMSAANAVSLGLTTAGLVIDNYDWARVIVIKGQTAKVYPFLSVGLGEDADPICVASFTLSKRLDQSGCHVIRPAMFSHLNDSGEAVYQDIVTGPSISVGSERSKGSVSLEYGSNLIPRCAPSPHSFQPAALDEQAGHVDGNYCCVKDQWAQVSHKLYRVFDHVPAKVNADVSAPVFLDGLAHENSMSFLFNVNGKTTLTFPTEDAPAPRRQGDLVDPVPFGGFSAFAFIKKHKGSRYGLDPNDRPHLYAHSGDLRQFPVSSFGNLVVVLAAKQRIENIRKCLSGGDLSQVAKLRLQEVETALKHFILGVLTTVTFKEESESAILNDVIQKAKAQAQGGKQ
jgi:hypothetical protein